MFFLKATPNPGVGCLARLQLVRVLVCLLLPIVATDASAQARSDLLIVMDNNGIGYTAQHTLIADDELLITTLPAQRETLETVFSGPGSTLYRRAHEKTPDEITLVSGTVFTRFRHRFNVSQISSNTASDSSTTPQTDTNAAPIYTASLNQFTTTTKNYESFVYTVSWILPSNIELLGYQPVEVTLSDDQPKPTFTWQQNGTVLTFKQNGGIPAVPSIDYRLKALDRHDTSTIDCPAFSASPDDACSPDIDLDSVPDDRDLCIDSENPIQRSIASGQSARSLGCDNDSIIVLSDLSFENGQSYLNVNSRTLLDKLAIALLLQPEQRYRIATYVEIEGNRQRNQELAQNRSDAIRHYLLLRGVGPNQIQSQGIGETSQASTDSSTPLASQRVELQKMSD